MQQQAQGGQMYRCPMCNGTGIFEYMPGDVMAPRERCTGCNGTGAVDAATAQSIMEMQQRVNSTFGGGTSGGGYGGGGGNPLLPYSASSKSSNVSHAMMASFIFS